MLRCNSAVAHSSHPAHKPESRCSKFLNRSITCLRREEFEGSQGWQKLGSPPTSELNKLVKMAFINSTIWRNEVGISF